MEIKRSELNFAILATDIAVLTLDSGKLKVLTVEAESVNFKGQPALPGGLVDVSESSLVAAKRILQKYLRSTDFYTEQLFTFDDPKRDPAGRVVSVAYLMLVPWNRAKEITTGAARWVTCDNLPKMAYDHNKVTKAAVARLKGKLTYTNIVFGLMPQEFTLTELQETYENILQKSMDKRNFRKKITLLGILKELSKNRKGNANRPAKLFVFGSKKLEEVEIL